MTDIDQMVTEIERLRALLPRPGERYVRCSEEIVAQLLAEPSQPVTLKVEGRSGNELQFILTRHDCPEVAA